MVNSIPSAVILCTRDGGSVVGSIDMRGRERARRSVMLWCFWIGGDYRRMKKMFICTSLYTKEREEEEASRRCN
jgi:hypothetical protein